MGQTETITKATMMVEDHTRASTVVPPVVRSMPFISQIAFVILSKLNCNRNLTCCSAPLLLALPTKLDLTDQPIILIGMSSTAQVSLQYPASMFLWILCGCCDAFFASLIIMKTGRSSVIYAAFRSPFTCLYLVNTVADPSDVFTDTFNCIN